MSPHFESPPPDPSSAASPPRLEPINLTRPTPRAPRSASRSARVRVLNRRREYLDRHPSYMVSAADNELADPLLYDSLIRRFQTPAERESDGRRRGYGHVLESSLLRSEAAAAASGSGINAAAAGVARMRIAASYVGEAAAAASTSPSPSPSSSPSPSHTSPATANFGVVDVAIDDDDAPPADRAEARARWLDFLRDRFVAGRDEDFDYGPVDGNDDLDALERRDAEDAWFDLEEPSWDGGGGGGGDDDDDNDDSMDDDDGAASGAATRERRGETGIQDY
ncbi:hypothetical protein RB594_006356 [Gaeumannomyces avenae]